MGVGASTTRWIETPGLLFLKSISIICNESRLLTANTSGNLFDSTESELTSGSEVSMPWLPGDVDDNR